jgi:ubiquitin C-terminal hydrolase
LLEEDFNQLANEIVRHKSTEEELIDEDDQIVTLQSCLQKYHAVEKLEGEVNCEGKCKKPSLHLKTLQTFRPPPILSIQLKRFKKIGTNWRK